MRLWILLAVLALAGVFAMIWVPLRLLQRAPAGVRRSVALLSGSIGVFLGVAIPGEVLLRRSGELPYERTFPGQFANDPAKVPWAQADPVLGWTGNRSAPGTNPQGFRDPRDFAAIAPDPERIRVMVLGDSFVWGAAVESNETIPALLEEALGERFDCFNLGVSAWGIDQMVLAYQLYRDALRPRFVILAFIDDDVRRVLESYRSFERMNKPCFEVRDDELVPRSSPSALESFLNRLGKKSVLVGFLLRHAYVLTEARPVVRRLLLDLGRATRERGEKLVVLRIPTWDEPLPRAAIRRRVVSCQAAAEEAGALYLDPREEIVRVPGWGEDFYVDDGHLSLAGNRFMAEFLRRRVFSGGK